MVLVDLFSFGPANRGSTRDVRWMLLFSTSKEHFCSIIAMVFLCDDPLHKLGLESTALPAKSDSDFMFCLQSYQGLIINGSLVY